MVKEVNIWEWSVNVMVEFKQVSSSNVFPWVPFFFICYKFYPVHFSSFIKSFNYLLKSTLNRIQYWSGPHKRGWKFNQMLLFWNLVTCQNRWSLSPLSHYLSGWAFQGSISSWETDGISCCQILTLSLIQFTYLFELFIYPIFSFIQIIYLFKLLMPFCR